MIGRRFRLRRRLGGGGMSVVWSADDQILNRAVAVKELAVADGEGDLFGRTLREARAAARVEHPGIVRIYDVIVEDRPWIIMEMLPGASLAQVVRDHGPLPVRQVLRIGLQLADALQALHDAGIVHGDVKPGNVQLCAGDRVILTDFGIATSPGHREQALSGHIAGSPAYMAPERVRRGELAPPADAFSLGVTLYALVEGRSPFDNSSPVASLAAVVHDAPRPFRRAGSLRSVIEGMLVKDPVRRLRLDQVRYQLNRIERAAGESTQDGPLVPAARPAAAGTSRP